LGPLRENAHSICLRSLPIYELVCYRVPRRSRGGAAMSLRRERKRAASKARARAASRQNGQMIHDAFVRKLEKHVDYVPVCPEVAIGLGVPRFPIRIVSPKERRLIQPTTGRDITEDMNRFCEEFLSSLNRVDGFILKFRSPSCGFKDVRIYQKSEKSPAVDKAQDSSVPPFSSASQVWL